MRGSILALCKYTQAISPKSNAAGGLTETQVDGRGFDRALFLVDVGTCKHTGATLTFSVFEAHTAGSTGSLRTGSLNTATAPTGANKSYATDVPIDPDTPYLTLISTAGTAFVNAGAICILYQGSRTYPVASQTTPKIL